ncbi:MAG: chemotaxis protein CheW [Planctomycetota bacterium]|nr:chemotaxis protein CheW [Planctomycetota bacterium]
MTSSTSPATSVDHLALAVRIGENQHAILLARIEEVLPALPIESVPQCLDFIRGVVFVRGHLIPVLDAAERLGLKNHQRPLEPHIVCLRVHNRLVGLEVDEALDLVDLRHGVSVSADEIGAQRGFFTGVVELDGNVFRLLDPDRLLADTEAVELDRVP